MRHALCQPVFSKVFAIALLALASCRGGEAPRDRPERELTPLDQAAIDAGIISDATTIPVTGSYERRHENGRNQLCIDADSRFGMIADLGRGLLCQGRGTLSASGDRLRFAFDGVGRCVAEGAYDGREIRIDGRVEGDCSILCSSRATFAGMVVTKAGEGAAQEVLSRVDRGELKRGQPLCSAT
ncbi:MAG: hypothetical protein GW859_09310 [Sphingomonadales bacterium]|nr:hypothetical protein [Sphingomonadales bacterium]